MADDYGMGEGGGPASFTLERFERVMMEATMADLMFQQEFGAKEGFKPRIMA